MRANARLLLSVTGVVEAATGVALLMAPTLLIEVLLGAEPDTAAGMMVARVAGAAVLSLAVACWLARDDLAVSAARGLVTAMLIYNFAVVAIIHSWVASPRHCRHRFVACCRGPSRAGCLVCGVPGVHPHLGLLERHASIRTHKGRSNFLNLRIRLSENRFRFSGRCCSDIVRREVN
jgi:hypothetical protein